MQTLGMIKSFFKDNNGVLKLIIFIMTVYLLVDELIVFFVHNLRQTEVGDLDVAGENISTSEKNITRFEIIMDDRWLNIIEILEGRDDLHNDAP